MMILPLCCPHVEEYILIKLFPLGLQILGALLILVPWADPPCKALVVLHGMHYE